MHAVGCAAAGGERVVVDCEGVVGVLEDEDEAELAVQLQRPQVFWQKPSSTPGAAPEMALHCPKLFCRKQVDHDSKLEVADLPLPVWDFVHGCSNCGDLTCFSHV